MSRLRRDLVLLSSILSTTACATGFGGDESAASEGAGGGSATGSGNSGTMSSGPSAQSSANGSGTGSGNGGQGGSGGQGGDLSAAATSGNAGGGPSASSSASGSGVSSTGAGAAGGAGSCGDGSVGGAEQCDDGDTVSGDGCSASCFWETNCQNDNTHYPITCGQTRSGDFFGTYGDIQNLCGKPFLYQDQIFIFTPAADATVTVTYTANPDQPDMAMFVMQGSCHSALCFADSTSDANRHDVTFQAKAGITYHIDLEAPSQQPTYSITLQCN